MTKEELEKDYYADRPTEPYCDDDSPNDWANIAHYAEENLEKAFKRIADLEAQIEKMKNCKNCKKLKKEKDGLLFCAVGSFYTNTFGKGCDKWEIKEK